jgi:hypothetical protein
LKTLIEIVKGLHQAAPRARANSDNLNQLRARSLPRSSPCFAAGAFRGECRSF